MSTIFAPITVLSDNFVDTDSTSIAAHLPNIRHASVWQQTASNSFYIKNNTLQPNRYTDGDLAIIESNISDLSITSMVTPFSSGGDAGYPAIVFRYTDANNFWHAEVDSILGKVKVYNKQAGTYTNVIYYSTSVTSGTPITLRIDCMGNNITLYVNGNEIVTYVSTFNNTATKVGVRVGVSGSPGTKPSWNYFQVLPFTGTTYNWPLFTEYVSNPILTLGAGGSWESSDLNNPNVFFDSVNSRYVLYYSGYDGDGDNVQSMGLAYSTTLPGTWTKETGNPVFASAPTETFGMNGGFVKLGSTWYNCYDAGNSIKLATSTDLINWTSQGVIISPGAGGAWDNGFVQDPFLRIRQDGVTMECWYCGIGATRSFGYATSTDGITWTKSSNNPIMPLPNSGAGDTTGVFGEPGVYVPQGFEGQQMLINFDEISSTDGSNKRFIGQAISVDAGVTWHYRTKALTFSGAGWESVQVFDGFPMVVNNTMYLFHSGSNSSASAGLSISSQIGVATAPFAYASLVGSQIFL